MEILRDVFWPGGPLLAPRGWALPNSNDPLKIGVSSKIIWLGDLNYRLASSCSDTHELLQKNDWQALLEKDQPGQKEFIHGGGLKKHVPLLEEVIVIQGAGHFINEEKVETFDMVVGDTSILAQRSDQA
ncbi:hypothetical protein Syun_027712 [Stephania yunnanensis]|uniref:Inositol polyphosphate-related phosphatase domain-containing protein n=1 Tax=Stephania yunnanensis TaxID=152371 RepID=A0AAP0EG45_9MAGN